MNRHVLQTLREQLKVSGSGLEGSELLTSEFLRFRSRLNETSGGLGKIGAVSGSIKLTVHSPVYQSNRPFTCQPNRPFTCQPNRPFTCLPNRPFTCQHNRPFTCQPNRPFTCQPNRPFTCQPNRPFTCLPNRPFTCPSI